MFREGIGVVVEGTMVQTENGAIFESDRLMVKHSNEYKAPEEGTDPKTLYRTVEENVISILGRVFVLIALASCLLWCHFRYLWRLQILQKAGCGLVECPTLLLLQ